MNIRRIAQLALIIFAAAATVGAQEKSAPPAQDKTAAAPFSSGPGGNLPLKVTVVVSRYVGEKRISSLPYVVGVSTNSKTTLRMGIEVPISTVSARNSGGAIMPAASYQYRSVGTNIDCQAYGHMNGIFHLQLTVSDSSIHLDPTQKPSTAAVVDDIPSFRNFNASFTALLRDGQATQYTSATDPVTGEVMKIDVTLNVMK